MTEDLRKLQSVEIEDLRRSLFGERCAHPRTVRLVVEGPDIRPAPHAPTRDDYFAISYRVTAYTDGRPDEAFGIGNKFLVHDEVSTCRCREDAQVRLERVLGANVEYHPRSRVYVASWRLVPPREGNAELGRNLLGTGPTVEAALANLAVLLRRGEKEVVH